MRRLILCILALATLFPSLAQGYDVLVLQSRHNPAFDEVLKGFVSGQQHLSQRVIVLSDYAEVDVVRIVREDHPALILALGDDALAAAGKVRSVPVIALMSLSIHNLKASRQNLTGIGMFAAPENYCKLLKQIKARRVGVVYNPAKSGWYLKLAQQAAEGFGITLVLREVTVPRDTLTQLASLVGKVDALWMVPDVTAVTRESAEAYFSFSQQQSVPVVSFASSYLGMGAAAVVELDRAMMGRQAHDLVLELLDGKPAGRMPGFPQGVVLKTNPAVLKQLQLADYL